MHFDWFNGIEILQGIWQHGEKVGYCYPSGLERTLCKWDIYAPLVTKGLIKHHALKIYEAVVVQLLIFLKCQHQMGDVNGQLHIFAILPAERFPLVPIQ